MVEDESETRELVSLLLRDSGADVRTASNAEAAIALLETTKLHVMVSDLNLPGADGCDLVRRVRETFGKKVPAIALSASRSASDAKRALEAVRTLSGPLSGDLSG